MSVSRMTKTTHITPANGNIFLDLGFDPDEAAALKAESLHIIAEREAVGVAVTGKSAESRETKNP